MLVVCLVNFVIVCGVNIFVVMVVVVNVLDVLVVIGVCGIVGRKCLVFFVIVVY